MAVSLLLRRRNEAVRDGIRRDQSLPRIALSIAGSLSSGIAHSRVISRSAGINQATEELETIGAPIGAPGQLITSVRRDIQRAHEYSNNYATRWLRKAIAEDTTAAKAAGVANAETIGSLNRIAVTESAGAFNDGRDSAVQAIARPSTSLLKVWDAELDKQTCPICSAADGTIVGIKERFPDGEPGAVHPWCRCTWTVLTFEEHGQRGYIEPKEPAKVISLPAPPVAPAPKPIAPKPALASVAAKGAAKAEKAALRLAASEAKKATISAEKLAEKEIKESLKAAGVKATGDARDTLKSMFGRVPAVEEIHGMLGLDSLGKFGKFRGDVEFSPAFGIRFSGASSNGAVSIGRKLAKDDAGKVVAKHDYLFLSRAAQGKGLGAAVLREQVTAYEKLGVEKITLNSAEIGRYYWPKIGFNNPGAFEVAQRRVGKWMAEQGIADAEKIAADTATMRDIASIRVGERKIGKEFLLSDDYSGGYLQLELKHGEPGFEAFKREVGLGQQKP